MTHTEASDSDFTTADSDSTTATNPAATTANSDSPPVNGIVEVERFDFVDVLAELAEGAKSQREKGSAFEILIKNLFKRHPGEYGLQKFEDVWLWAEDWPGKQEYDSPQDIGVDLVGKLRTGGRCAIQCKFYASGNTVPKKDIDSFIAASPESFFEQRILVTTGELTGGSSKSLDRNNTHVIDRFELQGWDVDWHKYKSQPEALQFGSTGKYEPRGYQTEALEAVVNGFAKQELAGVERRGKMILPCGVGKSVLALWIAEHEDIVPEAGRVLYLVPSIALLGQTMREWARQCSLEHKFVGVCSDSKAGRSGEDVPLSELAIPVTTDVDKIVGYLKPVSLDPTVVFSTYQSLPVIVEAQQKGAPEFDLVICDEAHRTTGVEKVGDTDRQRAFTLVHDATKLEAKRRLYMTATSRIYTEASKQKASDKSSNIGLYSMDDEESYGPVFYQMSFGEAVRKNYLTPYEVIVLMHDGHEDFVNSYITNNSGRKINANDCAKLLGCWDALADPFTKGLEHSGRITGETTPQAANYNHTDPRDTDLDRVTEETNPQATHSLLRCIAFSNTIATSKTLTEHMSELVQARIADAERNETTDAGALLKCRAQHIDGKMNSFERSKALDWLRDPDSSEARILNNARCLTEGVDVPSLDAVIFMEPKQSEIDVVQAVGRVMRCSQGKKTGYIILPVLVQPEDSAEQILESSDFKKVWRVLRALRAHDEGFNALVNTPNLNPEKLPVQILDRVSTNDDEAEESESTDTTAQLDQAVQSRLPLIEVKSLLVDYIFDNVGDRQYWQRWAKEVADNITKITQQISAEIQRSAEVRAKHDEFLTAMRETLNNEVSADDLTEMLAQHVVTLPVFEALFEGDNFALHHPLAQSMNQMLDQLDEVGQTNLREEQAQRLAPFYKSVETRLEHVTDSEGRLQILLDLYEAFFKVSMPKETSKLGVAYTPVELVDFVLRSVDEVCRAEFKDIQGEELGVTSRGVHILEPFAGTGTFINRLLTIRTNPHGPNDDTNPHLIRDKDLTQKFLNEIHANEILLLAYYMAAVKIEEGYRERLQKHQAEGQAETTYPSFPGLVLTDTFTETRFAKQAAGSLMLEYLDENTKRNENQAKHDVRIIVSNPPWSAGQKSAGEDNPNVSYPELEERIRDTYAAKSTATLKKTLHDSYKKALRWATDRLNHDKGGIVAYILPNSIIDSNAEAGVRACFAEEFSSAWVYNLRGKVSMQSSENNKEGGQVFGNSTKQGVCLLILVKHPDALPNDPVDAAKQDNFKIYYRATADYSTRDEKLAELAKVGAASRNVDSWTQITPDANNHWITQEQASWKPMVELMNETAKHALLHPTKTTTISFKLTIAQLHSCGIGTGKDEWVYTSDKTLLASRMLEMLDYRETVRQNLLTPAVQGSESIFKKATTNTDLTKFKWIRSDRIRLKRDIQQKQRLDGEIKFDPTLIRTAAYRPFYKTYIYFEPELLSNTYRIPKIFLAGDSQNTVISVAGKGATTPFSVLATDTTPDIQFSANGQVLPRHSFSTRLAQLNKQPSNPATQQPSNPATQQPSNVVICFTGKGASVPFSVLATDTTPDLHFMDTGQVLPRFAYPTAGQK